MENLETVIKHIEDVPRSRFNRQLDQMSDSERLRLKMADMLLDGKLSDIKDWYLDLRGLTQLKGVTVDSLADYIKQVPSFDFAHGPGYLRYKAANWLLDGTLDKFSSWYIKLMELTDLPLDWMLNERRQNQ